MPRKANLLREYEHAQARGWPQLFARSARKHALPVSWLWGIASRETRVGTTPILDNWTGDGGHGRGIMQIDDRFHVVYTSSHADDDHAANIEYGAALLAKNLERFPQNDRAAIAAYNCGPGNVRKALRNGLDVDAYTTGRDYSADVLARAEMFESIVPGAGAAGEPVPVFAALAPAGLSPLGLGSVLGGLSLVAAGLLSRS